MDFNTEYYFARYCGVAMAGLKPASLVQYPKGGGRCVHRLSRTLGEKGICFRVLDGRRAKLIMVYRKSVLAAHLALAENREFLLASGYPDGGTDRMIAHLERRMRSEGFPHEIGVFLGYPIEDVCGFMQRPDVCEYCGMWKVYDGVEEKKELFSLYKDYTDKITAMVLSGRQLAEIYL